jgi:predicted methyltransferase
VTQRIGDSNDVVPEFEDGAFDGIIHDPPMFSLAGHLYGADFYAELHRVLAKRGRLFHYIGDPNSRSGANVTRGVIRRLNEVGFRKVQRRPRAFGVVAVK